MSQRRMPDQSDVFKCFVKPTIKKNKYIQFTIAKEYKNHQIFICEEVKPLNAAATACILLAITNQLSTPLLINFL